MVGVLIIGVLRNGLNLLGVSPFIQQIVIGAVIAVAVAADTSAASSHAPETRPGSANRAGPAECRRKKDRQA